MYFLSFIFSQNENQRLVIYICNILGGPFNLNCLEFTIQYHF